MPSNWELKQFEVLKNDHNLKPEVKVWFLLFVLKQDGFGDCLYYSNIRKEKDLFFEEYEFIRHCEAERRSSRVCCARCNITLNDYWVHRFRGFCGPCNHELYGSVSKETKERSWLTYIGRTANGGCFCCNTRISSDRYSAAHVVAAKYGGKPTIENIRPTCASCNAAMGTKNLNMYKLEIETIRAILDSNPGLMMNVSIRWRKTIEDLAHIPRG
jgi:hypothetical protein